MTDQALQRARRSHGSWAPGLSGKVAIVTGAGRLRSIGRAVALELARQGARVVVTGTGRRPEDFPPEEREIGWADVESVADEIRDIGSEALACKLDVSNPSDIEDLLKQVTAHFGSVDILINNAGAPRGGDRSTIIDLAYEDWQKVLRINTDGVMLMSKFAARHMVERGRGGSIVNISSIASRLAAAGNGAYSASKAAINALSRTLALELAAKQIRVNSVLPGVIETARMDDLGRGERWKEFVTSLTPLGTAGTGMEVAYLCTFLCSDLGAWITGQDIAVDGGATWH